MIISEREARVLFNDIEQRGEQLTQWELEFIDSIGR